MQSDYSSPEDFTILTHIKEGMDVYDNQDHKVGTVDYVYMGQIGEDEDRFGTGAVTTSGAEMPENDSPLVNFAFGGAVSPSEQVEHDLLRARLLREGYIRVDTSGLFNHERYVTRDQVVGVEGEKVLLSVSKDDLIEAK